MPAIPEMLALALQHHQAGNLSQAEQLYRHILRADPGHADAHHLLGVLACQAGRHDQAVASIRSALALDPRAAAYHANLGVAYEAMGQFDEAAASYQQALRLRPVDASAHYNLGNTRRLQGKLDEAVAHYHQALGLKPDYAPAHCNLGLTRAAQGKLEEAVAHYQEALRLNPNFVEAHTNLGAALTKQGRLDEAVACYHRALRIDPNFTAAHHSLGCTLQQQDKLDEAIRCYQQAVRLDPRHAEAYNNLGYILERQGQFEEAVRSYRQAIRINPSYAEAYDNLGNALDRQDKLDEAISCYHEALRLKPNCAVTYNDLGTVRMRQGKFDDALAAYEQALRLQADFPTARLNRALLWLLLGTFEQGWPDFEWRWSQPGFRRPQFAQPLWDGSDLGGRSMLLYGEQGLGDTFQFIRYAPLVQERGGKVSIECQPALLPLLANVAGVNHVLANGSPLPAFDLQAPLLSLPSIFRTSLTTVPARVPYLSADAELVQHWKSRKSEVRSPKSEHLHLTSDIRHRTSDFLVGIAWQGSATYRYDGQRSIPLAHFARLAKVHGVQLISLQKGPGTEQLRGQFPVLDLGNRLDETSGAFMDTAAVMMNIDLVISSDTAVAHLAGALGVPIWVALSLVPDWRWLLERDDSPWYPTMRLFRQTRRAIWEDVFDRMAEELKNLCNVL